MSDIKEVISELESAYQGLNYICHDGTALAVHLARELDKPILVEGPPGVGKTELAKASAALLGKPLIRLQCYEGLDETRALYEWKYGKQLLYTQVLKDQLGELLQGVKGLDASVAKLHEFGDLFYSPDFIEPRPLLHALQSDDGCVLLIDEIDKADAEFEAFLLELLSDYQISIPEIGTITAKVKPLVFLTSNATRELGDALKRRCLHLHLPYPDFDMECKIVESQVPDINKTLRKQLVLFVQSLRELNLRKSPAISETIDWARCLVLLHVEQLDAELVQSTLSALLKYEQDVVTVRSETRSLLSKIFK